MRGGNRCYEEEIDIGRREGAKRFAQTDGGGGNPSYWTEHYYAYSSEGWFTTGVVGTVQGLERLIRGVCNHDQQILCIISMERRSSIAWVMVTTKG